MDSSRKTKGVQILYGASLGRTSSESPYISAQPPLEAEGWTGAEIERLLHLLQSEGVIRRINIPGDPQIAFSDVPADVLSRNQSFLENLEQSHRVLLLVNADTGTRDRLRIDKEYRAIQAEFNRTSLSARLKIERLDAATARDLQDGLNRHKPSLLVFSGHGDSNGCIALEDDSGGNHLLKPKQFANVIQASGAPLEIVVLNCCFSVASAAQLAKTIPFAVGTSDSIGDRSAEVFIATFFNALGHLGSPEIAFQQAVAQVDLIDEKDASILVLKRRGL